MNPYQAKQMIQILERIARALEEIEASKDHFLVALAQGA